MRIALLNRRFDPHGGGTERDLIITARILARAGHTVTVYASEIRGDSTEFNFKRVGLRRVGRALGLLSFAYAAPSVARRDGSDLVVSFARVVGADVLRSGGSAHASYLRASRQWVSAARAFSMTVSPYHRIQMHVERAGFSSARLKLAVAVSDFVRHDLISQFDLDPEKVVTVYNGVDSERFRPAVDDSARHEVRKKFGIPDDVRLVVFVGNGFGRKGLGCLIDAWPKVRHDAHLLVVGSDRAAASFRVRAERLGAGDRIHFAGPQPAVERIFQAADAFAMPSMFEPFGNVVLEAMASGLPAVASAVCGVAEVMPREFANLIVRSPTNADEVAYAVYEACSMRGPVREIARATAERFTWDAYGTRLVEVLESIG
ncbi:MAG TPA: glycosyltransferase family 4 protein [Candidatus Binataceae bacterium]|nr:glycosyltransferase family 4 protein [Candidatus Binataceae bacterium]